MAQKIIKIGNSYGITIPKAMLSNLSLRAGSMIDLFETDDKDELRIAKMSQVQKQDGPAKMELEKWLKEVLEEDAEALDELSVR